MISPGPPDSTCTIAVTTVRLPCPSRRPMSKATERA
jgi:hypothetical protein